MALLNVTNFSGTGTITYTISATGVTTITGTIVDGSVTVDGIVTVDGNLLAGNPLLVNAGADITYTLTLEANAAITYTIVGTKQVDYGDSATPTHLEFTDHILTIENIIDANDTDVVSFTLPANNEMASLNVTNFSGTGTITYTVSATGATTITGTIVDGSVTVDGIVTVDGNMLAGNRLFAGADITYTLTLITTASAAITYTIVGTKHVDYGTSVTTYGGWGSEVADETYRTETIHYDGVGDNFGESVAIYGDYMMVGKPNEINSTTNNTKGSVYVYKRDSTNGWPETPTAKLEIAYANGTESFGKSIAMNENYMVVGALYDLAVVFEKNGSGDWTETTRLSTTDYSNVTQFGVSVAISGNYIVVGSVSHTTSFNGSAYIYELSGGSWGSEVADETYRTETKKISPSVETEHDRFGASVAINGNYIIVGAYKEGSNGSDQSNDDTSGSGAAYLFERDNSTGLWPSTETKYLKSPTPAVNGYFGWDVSISENYIVIGEKGENKAYIFDKDQSTGWPNTPTKIITAGEEAALGGFGSSIALNDNRIVIGADLTKSAYIFDKHESTGWPDTPTTKLLPLTDITEFGWSAAMHENYIGIGTRLGYKAYVFERPLIVTVTPKIVVFTGDILTNTLTVENSIDANDTDVVSFTLPANNEMASLNVTNFSGTGTISYTISATGATTITGTIVDGIVTVDGNASGTNLLAGNRLVANAGADITYTLTLEANAVITYTIVGTKHQDYGVITYGTPDWSTLSKTTISPDDPIASGTFGSSIAISGNYAIVGGSSANTAWIFEKTGLGGWSQVSVLESSHSANAFGYSVAIDGDYAIVGALTSAGPGVSPGYTYGSAHIFKRNGSGAWNEEVMLQPTEKLVGSNGYTRFGWSVAIDGDYVAIGATNNSFYRIPGGGASAFGSAHIYKRDSDGNWNSFDDLIAFNSDFTNRTGGNTNFGITMAIQGDELFVGSGGSVSQGGMTVHVFKMNSAGDEFEPSQWIQQVAVDDGFSKYGLAVNGDYMIVGAIYDDHNNNSFDNTGAAFIYARNSSGVWTQQKHIYVQDPAVNDEFGWSVAIHGDRAIVCSRYKKGPDNAYQGVAVVYERNGTNWNQIQYLVPTSYGDQFGYAVAMDGDAWLVGEIYEDSGGVVYSYGGNIPIILNPTPLDFTDDILTIQNSIDASDTDPVSFTLPVNNEMAALNVTNFSGTGTISYTISATGVTTITGTIVDGIVTVDGNAGGTNMLAGNPLLANAGADITYTLTLEANAAITYTIVGTKQVDYLPGSVEREYPPAWVSKYIFDNTATKASNSEWTGTDVSFTVDDANETYGQGTYTFGCSSKRNDGGATDDRFNMTNAFDNDLSAYSGDWKRGWYSSHTTSITNDNNRIGSWTDLENATSGTNNSAALTVEFPESFQPTKFKFWGNNTQSPTPQYLYGYDETNSIYNKLHESGDTWSTTAVESYEYNITQTTPKSYKKYAISSGNMNFIIWPEIRLWGIVQTTVVPTDFTDDILTIQNSIDASDTDTVIFKLLAGEEMASLNVTNFSGTGTISYTISATGATTIIGTIVDGIVTVDGNASGTNLLAGNQLVANAGADITYTLRLAANAAITYTILGTKNVDYGDSATHTTLFFNDNVLTIENSTGTTDTDVIDFVLPAGHNIPELIVNKFTRNGGTGDVTYALTSGGNTIASGTFSAISSNLLPSGFPIFALSTDVTYSLTISAADTIDYTIVGTRGVTNLSNYSITHLLRSGFTEEQLIDFGIWNADSNANHFNPTYINGFLDASGNITVTNDILMDTGDIDLHSFTHTDPYVFTADVPINNRLFVVGDVSMGDASLNIVGDISINGVISVGSYKSQSISLGALIQSEDSGYSNANSITTFTEDIAYDKKIQFNGDISLNMQYVTETLEPNPNSTTYFGENTKIKANNGIKFPDGTTLQSSNLADDGTTFKSSTFEKMTVMGNFTSPSAVNVTSDYRIKNNVETLDETHTVDNLRPVKYYQTQAKQNSIGFLAHELQEHYPELIEGVKDGTKMQSVNYNGLLPILINEVQQLKRKIAEKRATK